MMRLHHLSERFATSFAGDFRGMRS
jgi:hypothetical protein